MHGREDRCLKAKPEFNGRACAPLPTYYGDEADHQRFLRRIFDETAADDDRIEAAGHNDWRTRLDADWWAKTIDFLLGP